MLRKHCVGARYRLHLRAAGGHVESGPAESNMAPRLRRPRGAAGVCVMAMVVVGNFQVDGQPNSSWVDV
jgi:hypothetical protein